MTTDYKSRYTGEEIDALLDKAENAQERIPDLEDIRDGATKGATPLQSVPEEYITEEELDAKGYAVARNVANALATKVSRETGKGLSTNDFTTALKEKLEALENYDDAELNAAIAKVRNDLDTLVDGDTSTAIKSFKDIIAFLEGIEDSESLDSIIASIETQIATIEENISDIDTIRAGASKGATSVQGIKVNGRTITRKDEFGAIDIGYNKPYRSLFYIKDLQEAVEKDFYLRFQKDGFVTALNSERPLEVPIIRGASNGIPASYYRERTAYGSQIIVDVIHGTKVYHLVLDDIVDQSFFVIGPDNTTCKDTSEVYITPYTLNEFAAANGRYLSVSKEFAEAAYNKKMILIPTGKTVANGYYVVATLVEAEDPALSTSIYLEFYYNGIFYGFNLSTKTVAPADAYCTFRTTEFVNKDMWRMFVSSDISTITRPNTQVDVYSIDGASFTRNGVQTAMTPNTVYEFTDNGVKRTIAVYDDHKLVITSADDVAFEYPIIYKSSERVLPSKIPSSVVTHPELREAIEEATPDWDSEEGAGFIKNRTHFAGIRGVFDVGNMCSLAENTGTHSPESYRLRYKGELYKLPSVGETAYYPNEANADFSIFLSRSTSGLTMVYKISSTVINEDVAGTEVEVVADYMSKKLDDFYLPDNVTYNDKLKTINGESIVGEGNITITGGNADLSNYYTKEEVDSAIASAITTTLNTPV